MSLLKQVVTQVIVWAMSLMVGVMVGARLLWGRWWKGPQFFAVKPRPTPPPILTDPRWGSHTYMHLKGAGLKLHYVEAGDRSKPLMVLVHGFPECWFSWRHQLSHFARTHWVVAMDLRGYGYSDKPAGTKHYKMDTVVEDIREFIQYLGREKCTLVAHDWGAVIAWQLVIQYPNMFSAHISCNGPHFNAFMTYLQQSWKQFFKSWYIYFFQLPWLPELMWRSQDLKIFNRLFKLDKKADPSPEEVLEVYKYHFCQEGALTPPINYYRNIFGSAPKMDKVRVPTLVIWGTEDMALDKPIAILSAAECETAKVKYVEGAGHFVQQEQPHTVNSHIQDYLDNLSSLPTTDQTAWTHTLPPPNH